MQAVTDFADESLDFVYIDGNHQLKYVVEDIVEWTKKIKKGGIIAGHDYIYTNPRTVAGICHVISSPTGVRGLNAKNGEHVIIARTPQEYAEESIKLLTDKNHFNKIRSNARKMVDTTYSWTAVSKNLEKVYKEMTYTS
jgi:glycosyltransferase involved in cell wall biosynthesis